MRKLFTIWQDGSKLYAETDWLTRGPLCAHHVDIAGEFPTQAELIAACAYAALQQEVMCCMAMAERDHALIGAADPLRIVEAPSPGCEKGKQ